MTNTFPIVSTISPFTRQIADAIGEACNKLNVQPCDLTNGIFFNWLKNDKKLTDVEVKKIRLHLQQVGGFQNLKNSFFIGTPSSAIVEREEMKSISKINRTNIISATNNEIFLNTLTKRLTQALKENAHYKPFGYALKSKPDTKFKRILNLALSDLHLGTGLDPREVPYRYGFTEEARRLASIVKRTCDFKTDYRDDTDLVVWLGGDIIKGIIHDMISGLTLAEQVADAIWILRQAIIIFSGEFKKVTIFCSSGNHDRNTTRHKERATSGKWDSFATHIYFGLKASTLHLSNVQVIIPRTTHVEYEPFKDQRVYLTHGDNNLNAGNPGKSINIARIETQMLRLNNGEVQRGAKPYGLFVIAHVHTGSLTRLSTGDLLTNGCLIPPDPYAISIGYNSTKNGQYLWESTPKYLVGDSRFLEVNKMTDKDSSFDKLIIPWNGEF